MGMEATTRWGGGSEAKTLRVTFLELFEKKINRNPLYLRVRNPLVSGRFSHTRVLAPLVPGELKQIPDVTTAKALAQRWG